MTVYQPQSPKKPGYLDKSNSAVWDYNQAATDAGKPPSTPPPGYSMWPNVNQPMAKNVMPAGAPGRYTGSDPKLISQFNAPGKPGTGGTQVPQVPPQNAPVTTTSPPLQMPTPNMNVTRDAQGNATNYSNVQYGTGGMPQDRIRRPEGPLTNPDGTWGMNPATGQPWPAQPGFVPQPNSPVGTPYGNDDRWPEGEIPPVPYAPTPTNFPTSGVQPGATQVGPIYRDPSGGISHEPSTPYAPIPQDFPQSMPVTRPGGPNPGAPAPSSGVVYNTANNPGVPNSAPMPPAPGGLANVGTTIQGDTPLYTPEQTSAYRNQQVSRARQLGNPRIAMKQFQRPGMARDEGTLAAAMPQITGARATANMLGQQIPLQDELANQEFMLGGQVARGQEANSLAQLLRRLQAANDAERNSALSAVLGPLLSGVMG